MANLYQNSDSGSSETKENIYQNDDFNTKISTDPIYGNIDEDVYLTPEHKIPTTSERVELGCQNGQRDGGTNECRGATARVLKSSAGERTSLGRRQGVSRTSVAISWQHSVRQRPTTLPSNAPTGTAWN